MSAHSSVRRVLVVDDSAAVRLYHASILRAAGFDVAEAINGYEALEAALGAPFDLFVVDVNMPRMDGYALSKALRTDVGSVAPIIVISTEADPHDAEPAYAVGANLYLVKPVRSEQLVAAVTVLTEAGRAGGS